MNSLKKIAIVTLKTILAFFVLVLVLVLVVLQWPETVINSTTARYFKPEGVRWDRLNVDSRSHGFLDKTLVFDAAGFCANWQEANRVCFSDAHAELHYDLLAWPPKVVSIGPVKVHDLTAKYVAPDEPSEPSNTQPSWPELPALLEETELKEIDIEVTSWEYVTKDNTLAGVLNVQGNGQKVDVFAREKELGRLELSLLNSGSNLGGDWRVEGSADYKPTAQPQPAKIRFEADPGPDGVEGQLWALLRLPQKVEIEGCRFSLKEASGSEGRVALNCPILASLDGRAEAGAVVTVDATTAAFPPSAESDVEGYVEIKPTSNIGLNSEGRIRADFHLNPSELPDFKQLDGDVDLELSVNRFQDVVKRLRKTNFAVPAPLDVLGGPVVVKLNGGFGETSGQLKALVDSNLRSEYQRLKTNTSANVNVSYDLAAAQLKNANVEVDARLTDVRLTLPPVGITPPSQIFADSRIQEEIGEAKKAKPGLVSYRVRIATDEPMRFNSEFAPEGLPVELALLSTEKVPLRGRIRLDSFPLEVLGVRRRVEPATVSVRTSESQTIMLGEVEMPSSTDSSEILFNPKPNEGFMPSPKLPLPLAEILSDLVVREPLSVAVVKTEPAVYPAGSAHRDERTELQWRRRY